MTRVRIKLSADKMRVLDEFISEMRPAQQVPTDSKSNG